VGGWIRSKVPWREELEAIDELEALSQEAVGHLISKRQYDFVSPHYDGPILLDVLGVDDPLPQYDHPHRELRERLIVNEPESTASANSSLTDIGTAAAKHLERIEADLNPVQTQSMRQSSTALISPITSVRPYSKRSPSGLSRIRVSARNTIRSP